MPQIVEDFRFRLEKALTAREVKPIELAEKTGISQSAISQYRSGYIKPKDKRLVKIAEALSVNPSWLMDLDVPMELKTTADFPLTVDEVVFISTFDELNEAGKQKVLNYISDLLDNPKYKMKKDG